MTVEYPFSLAQLAQILSALENQHRNPNSKATAIKAIERNAAQLGLTAEDVFDAADGLLSGRLDAAAWRAQLTDAPATIPAAALDATPAALVDAPDAQPHAEPDVSHLGDPGDPGDTAATVVAEATDDAPVAAPTAVTAAPVPTEPTPTDPAPIKAAPGVRQQLLAACHAAAAWLQQEPQPGQAEAILAVLQAAIARAEGGRIRRQPEASATPRTRRPSRENTKESQVIAMLRRPEGATLAQIGASTGWRRHTIRGFFAAALKKRHGLAVTSEKPAGGERTYRVAE